MSEYGIYEVHFSEDRSNIEEVHAYGINTDNQIDGNYTFKKSEVIKKIEDKNTVRTLIKKDDGSGNWTKGAEVIVVVLDEKKYIKTKSNNIKEDNLGELPEY